MDWLKVAQEYGLPITGFAVFVAGLLTGKIRMGRDVDASTEEAKEDAKRERAFLQTLWESEKKAREAAETRMDEALAVAAQATDLAGRYEQLLREKLQ